MSRTADERNRAKPSRIHDTLQRVLQRIDPDHRMDAFRVWTFWDAEVGESVARHAQPHGFRAGVLTVRVDSSTWMQELQFLKHGLRDRLNSRLGEALIRDIYFVSGKPMTAPEKKRSTKQPARPSASPRMAMPRLQNQDIADVFRRIAAAQAKRQRQS